MSAGTMSGSVDVVMDNTVDMVEAMANINAFYRMVLRAMHSLQEGSLDEKNYPYVFGGCEEEDADLLLSVATKLRWDHCAFGAAAW